MALKELERLANELEDLVEKLSFETGSMARMLILQRISEISFQIVQGARV